MDGENYGWHRRIQSKIKEKLKGWQNIARGAVRHEMEF